jgi:hypothetical protein
MPCLFVTNIVDVLMYNYMLFFRGKINERHPANDGFQREQYGRHIGNLIYDAAYCFQIVAMWGRGGGVGGGRQGGSAQPKTQSPHTKMWGKTGDQQTTKISKSHTSS